MKRKTLVSLCIAAVLVAGLTAIGFFARAESVGTDPTVVLDGSGRKFDFYNVSRYESNEHYPNLFADASFTGMMPGDSARETITVSAKNLNGGYADIFLAVERMNPENMPQDITEQEARNYELLMRNATLTVKRGNGDVLTLSATDPVHLGTFHENDSIVINVDFNLLKSAGDDLQNLRAEIGWVFTANIYENSGGGGGGGGGGTEPTPTPTPTPGENDGSIIELEMIDHFAYIIGKDDGLVHPEASITRAEVASIFFRMLTDKCRNYYWSQTNPYPDVFADDWYNNAISTLTNAGILSGRTNGNFDPNASITRAEFAAVVSRFFEKAEIVESAGRFTDTDGHWACGEIYQVSDKGLIEGYPDGSFRPNEPITRAEAVTIVNNLLDRKPRMDHLLPNMIRWPDNMDTTAWYYTAMQEATNSHTYERIDLGNGDSYEIWESIQPNRNWVALEKEWSEANSADGPGEVISSRENADYR